MREWILLFSTVTVLLLSPIKAEETKRNVVRKPEGKVLYVFKDQGSRLNNFCPSGWMGSTRSLKFMQNYKQGTMDGGSAIRVEYNIAVDTETTWAGIYFQYPCDNWSNKEPSYDLTGFKKLSFWVKGVGYIEKFMVGGIASTSGEGDSDEAYTDRIELTNEWKEITIPLTGLDLHRIIGGFGFAVSAEYNEKNMILFIDEIKFEK